MDYKIPTEAEIKIELARQCSLSIERLKGYTDVFAQMSIDYNKLSIPASIKRQLRNFIESQILLEQANINAYGNENDQV